jgi:hypothetical protein
MKDVEGQLQNVCVLHVYQHAKFEISAFPLHLVDYKKRFAYFHDIDPVGFWRRRQIE